MAWSWVHLVSNLAAIVMSAIALAIPPVAATSYTREGILALHRWAVRTVAEVLVIQVKPGADSPTLG